MFNACFVNLCAKLAIFNEILTFNQVFKQFLMNIWLFILDFSNTLMVKFVFFGLGNPGTNQKNKFMKKFF